MPGHRTVSFGMSLTMVAAAIACSSDSASPTNPSPLLSGSSTTITGTPPGAGGATAPVEGTSLAGPKVELCHVTGTGSYELIEVDESLEPDHRAHGDGDPLGAVPGESPLVFDDACGIPRPGVDIEKATNGADADTEPGPEILVGLPVDWTYVVTNTGDFELTNVVVEDDQLGPAMVNCPAGSLSPGASMTCTTVSGIAVADQYANIGTVTADVTSSLDLDPVADADPSHYLGIIDTEPPEPENGNDNEKIQLCHRTGNARYILIEVSAAAEPAHLAHGDVPPPCPVS